MRTTAAGATSSCSPPAPVSEADTRWFAEHGWWISPSILTDDALLSLEYGIERFYARDLDWRLPAVPPADSGFEPMGVQTRQNDYVSLQVAEIRSFVLNPLFRAIAVGLGGLDGVRLFHDQLISKPPGKAHVGWHTDRSYWLTCSSQDMLTIWVPLIDVHADNGALKVLDGSHLWDTDHNQMRGFHHPDPSIMSEMWRADSVRTLSLCRGQVSVHHAKTIHGSGPNRGTHPRTALAIHLQPGKNHYLVPPPGAPPAHFNDVLCRRDIAGRPDYADPHVCPSIS
ncbi:phytanoyl-CoA dioxygenase family protein [Nocardia sp. NPDC051756]|uniref:phytanoyl-CoA dioxygenase family protein n=1 Tax=Nocardia sp. NPDC051756 TaxID=3154751 RepID=UPI00344A67B7